MSSMNRQKIEQNRLKSEENSRSEFSIDEVNSLSRISINKKIYYQFLLSSNNQLESQEFGKDRYSTSSDIDLGVKSELLSSVKETQNDLLDNKIISLLHKKIKIEENPYNGLKRVHFVDSLMSTLSTSLGYSSSLKIKGGKPAMALPTGKKKLPIFTLSSFFPYRKTFLCYWLLPFVGFVYTASTTANKPQINSFFAGREFDTVDSRERISSTKSNLFRIEAKVKRIHEVENSRSEFSSDSLPPPFGYNSMRNKTLGQANREYTSDILLNSLLTKEFNVKSNFVNTEIQKYCQYYLSSLNDYVNGNQVNLLNEFNEIQYNKVYSKTRELENRRSRFSSTSSILFSKMPFNFQNNKIDSLFRLSVSKRGLSLPNTSVDAAPENSFHLKVSFLSKMLPLKSPSGFSPLEAPYAPYARTTLKGHTGEKHGTATKGRQQNIDLKTLSADKSNKDVFFNPIISYSQASTLLDAFSQKQFFTKNKPLQPSVSNLDNPTFDSFPQHVKMKSLDFYAKFFSYENIISAFNQKNRWGELENRQSRFSSDQRQSESNASEFSESQSHSMTAFGQNASLFRKNDLEPLAAKLKLESLTSSLFLNKIQNVSQKASSVTPKEELNQSPSNEKTSYSKLSKDQLYKLLFSSLEKQMGTSFVPPTFKESEENSRNEFSTKWILFSTQKDNSIASGSGSTYVQNEENRFSADRSETLKLKNQRSDYSSIQTNKLKTLKLAHPFLMSITERNIDLTKFDEVDSLSTLENRKRLSAPEEIRLKRIDEVNSLSQISSNNIKSELFSAVNPTVDLYQTRKSDLNVSYQPKTLLDVPTNVGETGPYRPSVHNSRQMTNKMSPSYYQERNEFSTLGRSPSFDNKEYLQNDFSNYSQFVKSYYYKLKNYIMYSRLKTKGLQNESILGLDNLKAPVSHGALIVEDTKQNLFRKDAVFNQEYPWLKIEKMLRAYFSIKNPNYRQTLPFRAVSPTIAGVASNEKSKRPSSLDTEMNKMSRVPFIVGGTFGQRAFSSPKMGNLQTKLTQQHLILFKKKLQKKLILVKTREGYSGFTDEIRKRISTQNIPTLFSQYSGLEAKDNHKRISSLRGGSVTGYAQRALAYAVQSGKPGLENALRFLKHSDSKRSRIRVKRIHEVNSLSTKSILFKGVKSLRLRFILKNRFAIEKAPLEGETEIQKSGSLVPLPGNKPVYSFPNKKHAQKKRRIKKLKKETRQRKKRKRFYPRPIWIRYRLYSNYLKNRYYSFNKIFTSAERKETTPTDSVGLFNESKSFYTISRPVLGELKRVLWKSYWLRSNLNPYLTKVKSYLAKIQKSKQSWEVYTNLHSFCMYFLGFNQDFSSTYQNYPLNSSLYLGPLTENKIQNSMYVAEYYRNVYERLQQFISQIRENLTLNGNIKVRASQVGHLPFTKGAFGKEKRGIAVKKNDDFWVKLGKTLTLETHQSSISPQAPSAKSTSKLRLYWAFSKTSYGFYKETHNRKRAWETTKQREQTKNNKTKKLYRNVSMQIQNLLTNSFPFIPEYLVLGLEKGLLFQNQSDSSIRFDVNSVGLPHEPSALKGSKANAPSIEATPVSTPNTSLGVQKQKNLFKTQQSSQNINELRDKTTMTPENLENLLKKSDEVEENRLRRFSNSLDNYSHFNKNINKLLQKALHKAREKDEKASVFQSIRKRVTGGAFGSQGSSPLQRTIYKPLEANGLQVEQTKFDFVDFGNDFRGVKNYPSVYNHLRQSPGVAGNGGLSMGAMRDPTTHKGNKKYILHKLLGYRNTPIISLPNLSANQYSRPLFNRDNIQNHLTTKSAYWWTEKISLDTLTGSTFSQRAGRWGDSPAILFGENTVKMKQSENSIFIVSSLLFHFCTLLSILSISHIRGFFKVSLLAISKIYKMSLGFVTPVVSSNISSLKYLNPLHRTQKKNLDRTNHRSVLSSRTSFTDSVFSDRKSTKSILFGNKRNFQILKRLLLNRTLQASSVRTPFSPGGEAKGAVRDVVLKRKGLLNVEQSFYEFSAFKNTILPVYTNATGDQTSFGLSETRGIKKTGTQEFSSVNSQFEFFKLFTFIYNLNDLISFVGTMSRFGNKKSEEKYQVPQVDRRNESSIVLNRFDALEENRLRRFSNSLKFSLNQKLYFLLRYSIQKPIYYFKVKTRSQFNGSSSEENLKSIRVNSLSTSSILFNKVNSLQSGISSVKRFTSESQLGRREGLEKRPQDNISLIQYSLTKLSVYSLLTMNTVTQQYYNLYFTTSSLLKEIKVNVFEKCLRAVYTFLEKPGEQIVDWVAYMFLVEWASDISNTIPENLDLYVGSTTSKLTRIFFFENLNLNWVLSNFFLTEFMRRNYLTVSLNLNPSLLLNPSLISSTTVPSGTNNSAGLAQRSSETMSESTIFTLSLFNFMNPFIQRRINHLYDILLLQFYQPDTDLITRQKKGILFWDIWGDFLMQTAEESNINISELTSVKEEQIKLLEKCEIVLDKPQSRMSILPFGYKGSTPSLDGTASQDSTLSLTTRLPYRPERPKAGRKFSFGFNTQMRNLMHFTAGTSRTGLALTDVSLATEDHFLKSLSQTDLIDPRLGWGAQQYLSYQGKDTELFIDLHPRASLDMVSLLKSNESVQQPIGTLVCQIYSGLLSKQISKNILVVGSSGIEKTLLIQAIAGETELKIITDNAYRYATVYRGVAVGIKLLRDVFDSLVATGPPCLFLIEDIHAIGEKRPLLISDDETVSRRDGASQEIHEKNQVFYQLSKHVITHYKKPYKGDFSLLIPTNHFCFDFFLVGLNSRMTNLYNPSNGGINPNTKMSGNTKKSVLPKISIEKENNLSNSKLNEVNSHSSQNSLKSLSAYQKVPSRLLIKSSELLSPPANSPFSFLSLVDSKKFKPLKTLSEMPWAGLPGEQLSQVSKASYSIRVKVALLADMAISSLSVKLDMITDLLVIIDSVKGNRGFVVFATTHVPYVLDPALRRPGRLDETISLGLLPSVFARWEILKASFSSLNSNVNPVVSGLSLTPSSSLKTTLDFSYFTKNVSNQYGLSQIQAKLFNYLANHTSRAAGAIRRNSEDIGSELNGSRRELENRRSRFSSTSSTLFRIRKREAFSQSIGLEAMLRRRSFANVDHFSERRISTVFTNQLYMTSVLQTFQKSIQESQVFKQNQNTLMTAGGLETSAEISMSGIKGINHKTELGSVEPFGSSISTPSNRTYKSPIDPPSAVNKLAQTLLSQTYYSASTFLMMTVPSSSVYNQKTGMRKSSSDKRHKRDIFELTPDFFSENSRIINLYASPQKLKTHLVYLISGKLGEMFLFQKKSQLRQFQTANGLEIRDLTSSNLFRSIKSEMRTSGTNTESTHFTERTSYLKLQNQVSGGYSSVGLSNTWQAVSTLVLSYIHKRYIYHKNLIVPKQLNFTNYSSLLEYPSPPATNILLPAKRYENYKRSFSYFASKRQTSIRIMDQINLHQQQRLVKRLYRFPVQELFRSEIMTTGSEKDSKVNLFSKNRFTTFTNASLMIGSYDAIAQKTSSANWFMKNRIFMRHKNYLTNQWWNGQLPEHNNETTFLSDIDWRYTFISSATGNALKSVKLMNPFDKNLEAGLQNKGKSLNPFEPKDILLDFPDADQHYNPRNRRWLITKGAYNNWFDFEKTIYSEIYSHFIFDSFIKAYSTFEQNRDILDFYAFYLLKNPSALVRTDRSVKLYERMFKTSNDHQKHSF